MKKTRSHNELEQMKILRESMTRIEEGDVVDFKAKAKSKPATRAARGISRLLGFGMIGDASLSDLYIAPITALDSGGEKPFEKILHMNADLVRSTVIDRREDLRLTGPGYDLGIAKSSEQAIAIYNNEKSTYDPDDEDFDRSMR